MTETLNHSRRELQYRAAALSAAQPASLTATGLGATSLARAQTAAPASASPLRILCTAPGGTLPDIDDPLGKYLEHARMLRVSPLIAVPDTC